ncbi:MAG: hypothetical protein C4332_06850, partial [Meiothermus sp.]
DGKENLKRLSEASGGGLLDNIGGLSSLASRKPLGLRPYLLVLALVLFLLERYLERCKRDRANLTGG